MSVRTGMANLITRLRTMSNSGTAVTSTPYFTDAELQDVLDSNVTLVRDELLLALPELNTSGTTEYHDYKTSWRDLEEQDSGTIYWAVRDGAGLTYGTANYSVNYINGMLRFTADTSGSAFYLTARSYDLNAAASDVFMQRAAYFSDWYQFEGDQQRFMRQQAYEQSVKMIDMYRNRSGQNRQRGSTKSNIFVRTDLNRSSS